jgi:hypothetical protein
VSTPSKPVEVVKEVSHSLTCLGGQGRESLVDLPWFGNRRGNSCSMLGRAVLKGRGLLGVHPFKTGWVAEDVSHSLTCLGGQGVSSVDLPWFRYCFVAVCDTKLAHFCNEGVPGTLL